MFVGQYRLLTRHFLRGFFENDLVSPDRGLQATLAPVVAAIAAPGLMLPTIWSFSYGWPYARAAEFQALVIRHEVLLVMFPMVVVALVTVLRWDSLYPDRRDAEVLGRLPVRAATLFWAKATALLAFVSLFAVASNGLPTILYPMVANMRPQPGSPGGPITALAHIVATFGAALFAVLAVLTVMGMLQLVLPARLRRSVVPAVQLIAVLLCVLALLMVPALMIAVDPHNQGGLAEKVALHRLYTQQDGETFDWADVPASAAFEPDPDHGGMRRRSDRPAVDYDRAQQAFPGQPLDSPLAGPSAGHSRLPWIFWFPPVWFLGWYEELAGRGGPVTRLLAARAQVSLAGAALLSIACYLAAYRRHLAGATVGEAAASPVARPPIAGRLASWIARMAVGQPAARAYFAFTLRTLVRSATHRLMISAALGAALAFVLAEASVGIEAIDPARPGPQVLSAQFVFAIFLLAGARMAFGVPAMLPANWTFRFHAAASAAPCATGMRRAVVVAGLVPLLLLLIPPHALVYGWRIALLHALCGLLASLVLLEGMLAGFPKVPFASPYVPGRAMIRSRLTIYAFVFQLFAYVLAGIESLLIPHNGRMAVLLIVLAGAYLFVVFRRRRREVSATLVFDEDLPDAVQTLGLTGPPRAMMVRADRLPSVPPSRA